ncbi:hypothetical protein BGX21_008999 [Mortierella sp. AD011]|nr:hypothetical protein BGX20_008952 [Mortierella sp. AD010]KAF9397313.1 hypothetical protein BGX21_008999 [Mortierella sp. AD011]
MNFGVRVSRHPDDVTMSAIPANIEATTRDYLNVLNRNVDLLKEARHGADLLEGKRSPSLYEDNAQCGNKGTPGIPRSGPSRSSPTVDGSVPTVPTVPNDPGMVILSPRERGPILVDPYHHCDIEDIVPGDFVIIDGEVNTARKSDEDETWYAWAWRRLVKEPTEKTGLAVIISMVPIVGPLASFYMSYKLIYRPLKCLKIGRHNREIVKCVVLHHMYRNLFLALFLPVIGPLYGRVLQIDQRAVDFACWQVRECVKRSSGTYKRRVDFYKRQHSFLVGDSIRLHLEQTILDLSVSLSYYHGTPFLPPLAPQDNSQQQQHRANTSRSEPTPVTKTNQPSSTSSHRPQLPIGWWDYHDDGRTEFFDLDLEFEIWPVEKNSEGEEATTLSPGGISPARAVQLGYLCQHEDQSRAIHEQLLREGLIPGNSAYGVCQSIGDQIQEVGYSSNYSIANTTHGFVTPQAQAQSPDRSRTLGKSRAIDHEPTSCSNQGLSYDQDINYQGSTNSGATSMHIDSGAGVAYSAPDTTVVYPESSTSAVHANSGPTIMHPVPKRPFVLFPFGPIDHTPRHPRRRDDVEAAATLAYNPATFGASENESASAMPMLPIANSQIYMSSNHYCEVDIPSPAVVTSGSTVVQRSDDHIVIPVTEVPRSSRPPLRRMNASRGDIFTSRRAVCRPEDLTVREYSQTGAQRLQRTTGTEPILPLTPSEVFRRGDMIISSPSSSDLTRDQGYDRRQLPPRTETVLPMTQPRIRNHSDEAPSSSLRVTFEDQRQGNPSVARNQTSNAEIVIEEEALPQVQIIEQEQQGPVRMTRSPYIVVVPRSEISPLYANSAMNLTSRPLASVPAPASAPIRPPAPAPTQVLTFVSNSEHTPATSRAPVRARSPAPIRAFSQAPPVRFRQDPRSRFANAGMGMFDSDRETEDDETSDDAADGSSWPEIGPIQGWRVESSEDDSDEAESQEGFYSNREMEIAARGPRTMGVYREYGSDESVGSDESMGSEEYERNLNVVAASPKRGELRVVNPDVYNPNSIPEDSSESTANSTSEGWEPHSCTNASAENMNNRWQSRRVRQNEPTLIIAQSSSSQNLQSFSSSMAQLSSAWNGGMNNQAMSQLVGQSDNSQAEFQTPPLLGRGTSSSQDPFYRDLTEALRRVEQEQDQREMNALEQDQIYLEQSQIIDEYLTEEPNDDFVNVGEYDEVTDAFSMAHLYQNDPLTLLNNLQEQELQGRPSRLMRNFGRPIQRSALTTEQRQNLFRLMRERDV